MGCREHGGTWISWGQVKGTGCRMMMVHRERWWQQQKVVALTVLPMSTEVKCEC